MVLLFCCAVAVLCCCVANLSIACVYLCLFGRACVYCSVGVVWCFAVLMCCRVAVLLLCWCVGVLFCWGYVVFVCCAVGL